MTNAKNPDQTDDEGDYEVGYGKPPEHTRFKSGQSGNLKGRPKGVRNFKTDVKATLKAPVKVTRDGRPRKVSTQKAMLLRLREKALSGDGRALDRLLSLAQIYNDEELTSAGSLSANDEMLLEIFRARVLSGAAGRSDPAEARDEASDGALSNEPIDLGAGVEGNSERTRVRLKPSRCFDAARELNTRAKADDS